MLNLCKPDSLYNEGMKILVYSERMASHKDVGWHRAGTKIGYYNNGLRRSEKQTNGRSYYTHTFTYNYEYHNDTVYLCVYKDQLSEKKNCWCDSHLFIVKPCQYI